MIYVVHTLLRHELSAYGPRGAGALLDAAGGALERSLARRADGILTLCEDAHSELAPHARGPMATLPPGLDPEEPPGFAASDAACRRHGLPMGRFALYTGNLDRYQDLDRLDAAAALAPDVPFVVATHDAGDADFEHLRIIEVGDVAEVRALIHSCGVAVLPRRRRGGFPIKLLNYMEAGRPILAHEGVGAGLVHGESAWLLPEEAGPEAWARSVTRILEDPEQLQRLASGSRLHLEAHHGWEPIAVQTLALIQKSFPRK